MDDITILQKAIKKAEKNGFKNNLITCFDTHDIPAKLYIRFLMCEDFAKAFWGEKEWKWHLQQIVLCENPLKYLEKFLDE